VKGVAVRYAVMSSRLEQFWLPAALCVGFAIVALLVRGSDRLSALERVYLGFVVPLSAGVLAAYAIAEDAASEIRFAAPIPAWHSLVERLGPTLVVAGVCAGAFQAALAALGGPPSPLGSKGAAQLAWLVPCTVLMAAGCTGALAGRKASAGALAVGVIWLFELIARTSFERSEWARYLLIFMGALLPDHPSLRANQCSLMGLCAGLLGLSAALLRRQERYL
jgi:hypothetical protein